MFATTCWWWTARRWTRTASPPVVGTYRLMRDVDAARVGGFYTAGEYDIAPMLAG